jgi:tryptophan 2-monooxygenase
MGPGLPDSKLFQRIGASFANMLDYLVGNPEKYTSKSEGKLYYYWNKFQTGGPKKPVIDYWQNILDNYKDVSFRQGIYTLSQNAAAVGKDKSGQPYPLWTLSDLDAFGALGVGSGGFGPLFEIGFLEILRVIVNGYEHDQELVPAGISTFVDALTTEFKNLGGRIFLNSPATIKSDKEWTQNGGGSLGGGQSNNLSEGPVEFYPVPNSMSEAFNAVSNGEIFPYDGLIIATTTRAMQMMGVTIKCDDSAIQPSALSQDVKTSVRNLHLTSSSKFFIRVKKKFWLEKDTSGKLIYPSNIQSDELFRGLYCLDYNPKGKGGGVVLISYVWEDDSTKLLGLTKDQRYAEFLRTLKVANPQFAKALDENKIDFTGGGSHEDYNLSKTNMVDWQAQPYYYGAFKLDFPGQELHNHDAVYQFQDLSSSGHHRLALCGDSVSWAGGWMEGALTSGLNAACAIANSLGGTLKNNSPLDKVKPNMYNYKKVVKTDIY